MEISLALPNMDAHQYGILQSERALEQSEEVTLQTKDDEYWRAVLSRHAITLVARNKDDVIIGTSGAKIQKDGVSAILRGLYVAKNERGNGIGKNLVRAMVELLASRGIQKIMTEINETNDASLQLHEKLGFQVVGTVADKKGNVYKKLVLKIQQ